jgi:hypothetical protein
MITPKKGSNPQVQNVRLQDSSCRPALQPVVSSFNCGLNTAEHPNSSTAAGNMQKSLSHQTFNTSKNNLVESTNTRPESTEKCSKLREILEKLPLLRKVSDGSNNGQREGNELAAASSQSAGSNQRPDREDMNSSPRIQMSLNRAMFDQQHSIQATPIKHLNPGFFMNNDSSDSLENTETKINGQSYHRKHSFPNVGAFCHQTPQQHKKQAKKPTVFSPTLIKPDQSSQPTLTMAAS